MIWSKFVVFDSERSLLNRAFKIRMEEGIAQLKANSCMLTREIWCFNLDMKTNSKSILIYMYFMEETLMVEVPIANETVGPRAFRVQIQKR